METAINTWRILRMHDLRTKIGLGNSTIFGLIAAGQFPKPFKLVPGGRAIGWFESDIDDWLANRAGRSSSRESS